jgi:hypothetical protein
MTPSSVPRLYLLPVQLYATMLLDDTKSLECIVTSARFASLNAQLILCKVPSAPNATPPLLTAKRMGNTGQQCYGVAQAVYSAWITAMYFATCLLQAQIVHRTMQTMVQQCTRKQLSNGKEINFTVLSAMNTRRILMTSKYTYTVAIMFYV